MLVVSASTRTRVNCRTAQASSRPIPKNAIWSPTPKAASLSPCRVGSSSATIPKTTTSPAEAARQTQSNRRGRTTTTSLTGTLLLAPQPPRTPAPSSQGARRLLRSQGHFHGAAYDRRLVQQPEGDLHGRSDEQREG